MAICGSSPATAATFASVAVPEMDRYGYSKKLSTGITASVGTLGIIIPPSVTLILFGIIGVREIDTGIAPHCVHGSHAYRRLHDPGSFPCRDKVTDSYSRLGREPAAQSVSDYDHHKPHLSGGRFLYR
jgi:hypothetical protein